MKAIYDNYNSEVVTQLLINKPRICIHHLATIFTSSEIFGAIKLNKSWLKILLDVRELEISFVENCITSITKPHKSVFVFRFTLSLNYKTDRVL